MANKETLKQAGYTFVKKQGKDYILKDEDGKLELFVNNPHHASWGIKDKIGGKEVDLEFVRSIKESEKLDEAKSKCECEHSKCHADKPCDKEGVIPTTSGTKICRDCAKNYDKKYLKGHLIAKESNVSKCLSILEGNIPNSTFIRDALDKAITGEDLSNKEKATLLKYNLINKSGSPTQLAKEEFSELFD